MHKYWGRKAHNLIHDLIVRNSKPGDLVLDPFIGSGVTLIEANKAGRRAIGFDLNPISELMAGVTLSDVDPELVKARGEKILQSMPGELKELSESKCDSCKNTVKFSNCVWVNGELVRVKFHCENCGAVTRRPSTSDIKNLKKAESFLSKTLRSNPGLIPNPELFKFVRRSGVTHLTGLFTPRNLLQVAYINQQISKVRDREVKRALQIAFTSMLPNVSRMIPADLDKVTGKSGWQISKFWVPKIHTDKDVSTSFKLRLDKVVNGLTEIQALKTNTPFEIHVQDSGNMERVKSGTVNLVIADPPYGDSISYLALSMFWNAWIHPQVDYGSEVIIDSNRSKGLDEYRLGLERVFGEIRRVLKNDGRLIVTFNNRHMKYWRPLIESIDLAGFRLSKFDWVDQAVRSGTQGINHANTLHGDFIYTYVPAHEGHKTRRSVDGERVLTNVLKVLFSDRRVVSTADIYRKLIPKLINQMAFTDSTGREIDIDVLLGKYCYFESRPNGEKNLSGWVLKAELS